MKVGITDVAREAGVTPGVVSRVLNDDDTLRIRPETRQRVLDSASKLDYTPSRAARSLRNNQAHALGLAVHDMSNPLYGEIIQGAQRAAAEAGYALLLADVEGLSRGDAAARSTIQGGGVDGLLLQRRGTSDDRSIIRAASSHIPTVLVNDTSSTLPSVALDDAAGARVATRHLLDLGHSRIGHFRSGGIVRAETRLRGWRTELQAAGIEANSNWVLDGEHTVPGGYEAMHELLAQQERPTAVVVANVLSGIGALTAARETGVRVPEELSIVAIHDVIFAAHIEPALTTVAMPLETLGAHSVGMLLDLLEGRTVRRSIVHEPGPRLIVRASTAAI